MEVKLIKGPMHGKRIAVMSGQYELVVSKSPKINLNLRDTLSPLVIETGRYMSTNRYWYDGTRIYEWVGWDG